MRKLLLISLALLLAPFSFCAAEGEIIRFPAKPEKGFYWPYFIYLPKNIDKAQKQTIVITPANTGKSTNDDAQMEEWIKREIEKNYSVYSVPDGLGAPMLMPAFPRRKSEVVPHDFDRDTLLAGGSLKRIDLQLLSMFEDARAELKKLKVETNKKFFMAGYSSAGAFVERFVLMHPKRVLSAVSGGNVGLPTLPVKEYDGLPLIYAVGIFDLQKITGIKFNLSAYKKVPQYIYEGAEDYNDPFPYSDIYGEAEKGIIKDALGADIRDRWAKAQEIINGLDANIQLHTYPDIGHRPVNSDAVKFLKANASGKGLSKIVPADTTIAQSIKDMAAVVEIEDIVFGSSNLIGESVKPYIDATDIVIILGKEQSAFFEKEREMLQTFRQKRKCPFDINTGDKTLFSTKECRGHFSIEDGRIAFHINISAEDFNNIKKSVKYTLKPRTAAFKIKENIYLIKG